MPRSTIVLEPMANKVSLLDAWSRRVVGYAIGRGIDARLAVKALRQAIGLRRPLPGCVFHTDRGSQYASQMHRDLLEEHGFVGSMSRRGNPYDNPQAESFMKTLKVEDAYLMEYETFEDVVDGLCCANRLLTEVPLSPDRLIPRLP
jgi:putative transposase